jgi:hypothetical protein
VAEPRQRCIRHRQISFRRNVVSIARGFPPRPAKERLVPARRAVEAAALMLLATAACDRLGLAAASFYLLVAAVPVTAVAGLACFARVVDGEEDARGRVQALLLAGLVAVVVLGAAARSPALAEGAVPPAASAAVVLGLLLLGLQALVALAPRR